MKDAIQVVYGGKEVGAQLIEHKPDKIHFTGSTRAGRQVMKAAAEHLIPLELELGGKDPAIVFEDGQFRKKRQTGFFGVHSPMLGKPAHQLSDVLFHESIHEQFVAELMRILPKLRVAKQGQNDGCEMGCMTADFQLEKVEQQLQDAVDKGATILSGGQRVPDYTNIFLQPL